MSRKITELTAVDWPLEALSPLQVGAPSVVTSRRRRASVVCDSLGVALGFAIALLAFSALDRPETNEARASVLGYAAVFAVAFSACGVYARERRRLARTNGRDAAIFVLALGFGAAAMFVLSHVLFDSAGLGSPLTVATVVALTLPAVFTVPICRSARGLYARRRGRNASRVIILGSGSVAENLAGRLSRLPDFELLGCVDDTPLPEQVRADWPDPVGTELRRLGSIADLPALTLHLGVDRVLVGFTSATVPEVLQGLRDLPPSVKVSIVPRFFDLITWRSEVEDLDGLAVIDIAPPSLGPLQRFTKRSLDLVCASVALVLIAPFWAVTALLIKLTSPGPVFFRQPRSGRNGKTFAIYKFRTMRVGAEAEQSGLLSRNEVDGPIFKLREDPRVTGFGAFLRKTSLDELPQLLNVLKGDMSLVGPRPFPVAESEQIQGWAARRFDVRPGMTGLWQVSGRNDLPYEELRRLDYGYVASWSLAWDLKILLQTPRCVLQQKGVY